jgi:hypothetical protein
MAWLMPAPGVRLNVSDPEGFRYYGLFPQAYIRPARELASLRQIRDACVIGLRTIGSALAAVVAATLEREDVAVRLLTLRPRGAPFERTFKVSAVVEQQLANYRGDFLIVDEGPGLSGSSFTGAAEWLRRLGVSRERITLLPSWNPKGDMLVNAAARREWEHWRKAPAEPLKPPAEEAIDLGGGQWRAILPTGSGVAVWPQQERAKFLTSDGMWLLKFSGLGEDGLQAFQRARELSACGFGPPVTYEGDGWLRYRRLFVHPICPKTVQQGFSQWLGRYLAFIRSHYSLGIPQPPSAELQRMLKTNLELLLRRRVPPLPPDAVAVALDGRIMPYEFGYIDGGIVKFDGVDHHDDHFFPGPADIAWDVAGVEVEFGAEIGAATCDEYMRMSGDANMRQRLPWYRTAYTAFRAAWCRFASERSEEPDRALFSQQHHRYLSLLSRLTAMTAAARHSTQWI